MESDDLLVKFFEKMFGEKFDQRLAIELAKAWQEIDEAKAVITRREVEVERRETEVKWCESEAKRRELDRYEADVEAKFASQWQELMLKILERRFKSVPVALIILLGSVTPEMRVHVCALLLDATDAEVSLRELQRITTDQK